MAGWEGRSGGHTRRERGAAAVEAGILVSVLLMPLVLGILQWGDYFWKAQRVDALAPAVPEGWVAGTFTCQGLKDAVASSVVDVVTGLDAGLPVIDEDEVAVTVVDILPEVGVVVQVHVAIEYDDGGLASSVPLPDGGALVTDFTQRLDDVTITDQVCR